MTACSWNERHYGLSMDALGARTLLWFGHGCSGDPMLLEHESYYGLGVDALVTVCSWNTNGIMVRGMEALMTVCFWCTNVFVV